MKRVATAVVLAPLITYIAIWAPFAAFAAVLAIVAALCYWEFSGIAAGHGIEIPRVPGIAAGMAILFAPPYIIIAVLITLTAMTFALRSPDLGKALPRSAAFMLGLLYVFGCWRFAIDLRAINSFWMFFALAINWVGDSAAMYVGRSLGRHKMAPHISPGKSWEGAVASTAGSVIFALIYAHWALPQAPVWLPPVAAVAGNIAGQLGDLSESAMKRGAGMKDSGTLLPGHGGWLDRVDSSLFSVPVVYALLRLLA
jgi:phosphatidate cytidylyltransferase